jgi:hypothetical protein
LYIWIAANENPGAGVGGSVGTGVGGTKVGVIDGVAIGVIAEETVAFIDCAVRYMTVGKYSGGKGVGGTLFPGKTQPLRSRARRAMIKHFCSILETTRTPS